MMNLKTGTSKDIIKREKKTNWKTVVVSQEVKHRITI